MHYNDAAITVYDSDVVTVGGSDRTCNVGRHIHHHAAFLPVVISAFTTLLEEVLFEAPDNYAGKSISVTKEMVEEKLSTIVKDKDLSRYVL